MGRKYGLYDEKTITADGTEIYINYRWPDNHTASRVIKKPDGTEIQINVIEDDFKSDKIVIKPDGTQIKTNVNTVKGDKIDEVIVEPEGISKITNYAWSSGSTAEKITEKPDGTDIQINYTWYDGSTAEKITIKPDGTQIHINYTDEFGKKYSKRIIKNDEIVFEEPMIEEPNNKQFIEKDPTKDPSFEDIKNFLNDSKNSTKPQENKITHGQIEICEFCQYYEVKYDECEYDRDCEYQIKEA